jgi:glycine/D-amino acid oxidase-like deaminating enzyme
MTVGHAVWPDQLDAAERARLEPGLPANLDRAPAVLIVGGGIIGCATAAECVRAGLGSVVVLERDRLGAGASGGAAGLLQPEAHVGVDPPAFVDFMRQSVAAWTELESAWPGGVGLLPLSWHGQPQARVNPLRALSRLAAGLPGIATGVDVTGVATANGAIHTVQTSVGEFRPRHVVFATGIPPAFLGLDVPAFEVKGHMLCSAPTSIDAPPDLVTKIEDGRLLMGGTLDIGDDERVVRPEVVERMRADLIAGCPETADLALDYTWACFRPAHPDHVPVIDRVPGLDNAWLTSGHYKTGILLAAGTARAVARWVSTGSAASELAQFSVARFAAVR